MRGIHRWPVNSPHKWPVTRNMFPFDDVIMNMGKMNWHHSPLMVPVALTDVCFFCDNGLFLVGLGMNWAVFVLLTCAKLKIFCVFYHYLQLIKVFSLQVYRWHLQNTNYIPTIHHIQHWLISHKLRGIGDVNGPAPTQPLSRVNEI